MTDPKRAARLDYKILHTTGEKVIKVATCTGDPAEADDAEEILLNSLEQLTIYDMADINRLAAEEATKSDDLDDFIEENQIEEIGKCIDDFDAINKKAEEMRSAYRSIHNQLKGELNEAYNQRYGATYANKIDVVKDYISKLKRQRKFLRDGEDTGKELEIDPKERKVQFLVNEFERSITNLENVFAVKGGKLEGEGDDKIVKRKDELSDHMKSLQTLTSLLNDIMDSSLPTMGIDKRVPSLNTRYNEVIESKDRYVSSLNQQVGRREIAKHSAFNSSKLNIKLPKFRGYKSCTDIYTFKSDFEKLYLRSTPKAFLPDLLKNNFLENPALLLVKDVDDIDDVWKRLKDAYGDCRIMLSKKLAEISHLEALWKHKDPEKTIEGLSKIINLMKDLMNLVKQHGIENNLYFSDALEKIQRLMGDNRFTRWLTISCDKQLEEGKIQWMEMILFLEKEVKIYQQKAKMSTKIDCKASYAEPGSNQRQDRHHLSHHVEGFREQDGSCVICGAKDHVATPGPDGTKLIQYFVCKRFVDMTPQQRFIELTLKNLCFQCLFPGAARSYKSKHKDGHCQRDFICRHPSHKGYPSKKHVLVCEEHKDQQQNKDILQEFKKRCIFRKSDVELPAYSKEIQLHLTYQCQDRSSTDDSDDTPQKKGQDNDEDAIYMMQTIKVDENRYSIFYDTGCREFVSRFDAIQRLGVRAHQELTGPITLGGVGGITTEASHGIYSVTLPLRSGADAVFTGASIELITETFPSYPLKGKVEEDIRTAFSRAGGDVRNLPALMSHVGGDTDLMLGIKYLRYFPRKVFQLPSGLAIYESQFLNADGSFGVVGGPHKIFTEIEKHHHLIRSQENFLSSQFQLFKVGYQVNPDVTLLGYKETKFDVFDDSSPELKSAETTQFTNSTQRQLKKFHVVEGAGSEIQYRCVKCRSCKDCKLHEDNDSISIKEEVEQDIINRSVQIDLENGITTAKLPLISDPVIKLCPNKGKALKVYNQQLKRLTKNEADRESVLKSEKMLQDLGFVDYVANLPEDVQKMLQENPVKNFIPWRVVWKDNSITTPCRVVFDASQPTNSGYSLNDVVAKGRNNMNKMVEIFIRWRSHKVAFHNDIQKMYNAVKLQREHWCLQRYLWEENLDPQKDPAEKVIKTLIYGVRSSGNQAEHALRLTAKNFKDRYPEVYEIVSKDVYVDDCMSGSSSEDLAQQRTDELEVVLNHGGFTLKGFTMSGRDPEKSLSSDKTSICVAGHKWYPKDDLIALDIKDLNFVKKSRGRKIGKTQGIPENLTRRNCTSKVAEIFDLKGLMTPIVATMKLDLHDLVLQKLDWDDVLPNNLQQIWHSHFDMMAEMKSIRYNRAIVPHDASDLNINTLDFGDASKSLVCIAIYARFKRKCDSYSCQLIFARSRLVPDGMSQPRAEMYAAVVNTHAGEVVRKAFYTTHQKAIKFTDSQIALHWISNDDRALKQWVRNRSIEIKRFTDASSWKYINSKDMIADIGTRRCSSLSEIDSKSFWNNGYEWMKEDESRFPMMTVEEISLSKSEAQEMTKESQHEDIKPLSQGVYHSAVDENIDRDAVRARYQYSEYVIDPNRRRFEVVVRILGLVMKFIKNIRYWVSARGEGQANEDVMKDRDYIFLSDEDMNEAKRYFYRKATSEIKYFLKPNQYVNISREVDGILTYTGRVLPEDEVTIVGHATEAMKDLCATTFCVPLVDKNSPIAFSVVNDIHWHDKTVNHCGVESVWRYVLKNVYVIEGRDLVKKIRISCERCRYLSKKTLDVSMGPISRHNITIAPAFYICQVDLAGPFAAYSYHNKRATIKIWLVVFCCTTTSATKINVMEDYTTTAFIQSFTRFSCQVGYPKRLLSDEGSQLVKGCQSMRLNLQDLKFRLHRDDMVDLEVCPVGGHNMHGRVERKIRQIKESLSKTLVNERLGIMQWETISATIANSINNLPLALGNTKSDFESMDLVTPNRLLLGRNNDRSPVGNLTVTQDYSKIISSNEKIHDAWFENWLLSHVPKLMEQPKWYSSDRDLQKGDVVLFLKNESEVSSHYQYGMVESIEMGRDGRIRKVRVKYRNHTEKVDRETYRSARSLVVIHPVDEINIMQELGEIARNVDNQKRKDLKVLEADT